VLVSYLVEIGIAPTAYSLLVRIVDPDEIGEKLKLVP